MKATRLYTRAYLTQIKGREDKQRTDDLSKIEIVEFSLPPRAHFS